MKNKFYVNDKVLISDVSEIKARIGHCIIAKMQVEGVKRKSDITYDVIKDNVIIPDWYRFDGDMLNALIPLLKNSFKEWLATVAK